MKKIIDMKAARKGVEQRKHRDMVLEAFDRQQHETKRDQRERAAEVRRKARNAF